MVEAKRRPLLTTHTISPKKSGSPYQQHKDKWSQGCGTELCSVSKPIIRIRGSVPCEVLFIGEAPGRSEVMLGQPFVGPAGLHLDEEIIAVAEKEVGRTFTKGFTNLIACMPTEEDEDGNKKKIGKPPKECIKACAPRLAEIFLLCKPKIMVMVGLYSTDNTLESLKTNRIAKERLKKTILCDIEHPASILRKPFAMQGLLNDRCVITLVEYMRALINKEAE